MKRDTRTKIAYIKSADWSQADGVPVGSTLESLLTEALKISSDDREWSHNHDSDVVRCIIREEPNHKGLACSFVTYERGKSIEVVTADDASGVRDLETIHVPQGVGMHREKLEGSLFFVVKGDRIIVAQSLHLRVTALDDHLNWLLRDKAKLFQDGQMTLIDDTPKDIEKQIVDSGVSEIKLGTSISEFSEKATNDDGAISLMSGLLGDRLSQSWANSLRRKFDEVNVSGLKTQIVVKAPAKAGEKTRDAIKSLALGMRSDLTGVTLVLRNGKEIKGTKLLHKRTFQLEFINGVASIDEIYTRLRTELASSARTADDE